MLTTLQTPGANVNDPAVRADINAAMGSLDDVIESVSGRIAGLGGAQNILRDAGDQPRQRQPVEQAGCVDARGSSDCGDAAVKLNGYTTAVQATQKAYAQVSKLSLFQAI